MKKKLNLTIEDDVLTGIKIYATQNHTSISELVESYFRTIKKPAKRKNILQLVDKLPKPAINVKTDLKNKYYEEQAGKYGF
jgi:hypothetical protein